MWTRLSITAALAVAALASAAPAGAGRVAVVVEPSFPLARYASRGAVGLLVPGAGSVVTRREALAELGRGRAAGGTAQITIHVALPPPGRSHNVVRYPVAILGGGYHGLLRSGATRIPGLVSISDLAPTVRALEAGRAPPLTASPDAAAPADLRRLDSRLAAAHDVRVPVRLTFTGAILLAFAVAFLLRSRIAARAAVLAPVAALSSSLVLSALHVYSTAVSVAAVLAACAAGAVVAALGDRATAWLCAAFLAAELLVLAAWPTVDALAPLGPHPDGGGRFYGVTNEMEAMLLAPALFAAWLLGPRALPVVAALALVLVGWSGAGADGGGLLVFAVAFALLWLRQRPGRTDPRRLALALAAAVLLAVALVGLDAATGGSSHVTHALGGGPGSLLHDLRHRWRVSWAGATTSWAVMVQTLAPLAAFAVFLAAPRRHPLVDAFLVSVVVSLLVNDTPEDVISVGAMCAGALWAWGRLELSGAGADARRRRRFSYGQKGPALAPKSAAATDARAAAADR